MKFFVWLFFLLIGGGNLWTAGHKILFIGDSITDGNWGNSDGSAQPSSVRNHWDMNHIYGSGTCICVLLTIKVIILSKNISSSTGVSAEIH